LRGICLAAIGCGFDLLRARDPASADDANDGSSGMLQTLLRIGDIADKNGSSCASYMEQLPDA
jgi:hypothetical protein